MCLQQGRQKPYESTSPSILYPAWEGMSNKKSLPPLWLSWPRDCWSHHTYIRFYNLPVLRRMDDVSTPCNQILIGFVLLPDRKSTNNYVRCSNHLFTQMFLCLIFIQGSSGIFIKTKIPSVCLYVRAWILTDERCHPTINSKLTNDIIQRSTVNSRTIPSNEQQ